MSTTKQAERTAGMSDFYIVSQGPGPFYHHSVRLGTLEDFEALKSLPDIAVFGQQLRAQRYCYHQNTTIKADQAHYAHIQHEKREYERADKADIRMGLERCLASTPEGTE